MAELFVKDKGCQSNPSVCHSPKYSATLAHFDCTVGRFRGSATSANNRKEGGKGHHSSCTNKCYSVAPTSSLCLICQEDQVVIIVLILVIILVVIAVISLIHVLDIIAFVFIIVIIFIIIIIIS